jgi:hypothetical protein
MRAVGESADRSTNTTGILYPSSISIPVYNTVFSRIGPLAAFRDEVA